MGSFAERQVLGHLVLLHHPHPVESDPQGLRELTLNWATQFYCDPIIHMNRNISITVTVTIIISIITVYLQLF